MTARTRAAARYAVALVGVAVPLGAFGVAPAAAGVTHVESRHVALIPQAGPLPAQGPNGIMPTSSTVAGRPSESFSRFSFANVSLPDVTSAKLAQFDTVALIQTPTRRLSSSVKAALAQFVAGGGKLLIHDSDETDANDYTWLLRASLPTTVGASCNNCGSSSGSTVIATNSGIVSANPADPSYVNVSDLRQFTDQGDANMLNSTDPRWFDLATGSNGKGERGAQVAFAHVGNGLIVYNGFDTDFIKFSASAPWRCNVASNGFHCLAPPAPQPTVDWLAHMWYSELIQGWGVASPPPNSSSGSGLPSTHPLIGVGTPQKPGTVGLPKPTARGCARPTLYLRLTRLRHMRHRTIVRVDLYVNRRHVLRERRPFRNVRLSALPRHGAFTLTEVMTTKRGFHLVARRRYRGCR